MSITSDCHDAPISRLNHPGIFAGLVQPLPPHFGLRHWARPDLHTEGLRQAIAAVGRRQAPRLHFLFALELDRAVEALAAGEVVLRPGKLLGKLGFVGNLGAGFEPGAHPAPALRPPVVPLRSVVRSFTAMKAMDVPRSSRADKIDNRTSDSVLVDNESIKRISFVLTDTLLSHPISSFASIPPVEGKLPALTVANNRGIVAVTGNVTRSDSGERLIAHRPVAPRRLHYAGRDELARARLRKLPAYSDPEKVGVLAVVLSPFLEQLQVRAGNRAGIDLARDPAVLVGVEAAKEPPAQVRRLPERQPDDFRTLVGQRALGGLPDTVGYGASLVEDYQ